MDLQLRQALGLETDAHLDEVRELKTRATVRLITRLHSLKVIHGRSISSIVQDLLNEAIGGDDVQRLRRCPTCAALVTAARYPTHVEAHQTLPPQNLPGAPRIRKACPTCDRRRFDSKQDRTKHVIACKKAKKADQEAPRVDRRTVGRACPRCGRPIRGGGPMTMHRKACQGPLPGREAPKK